MSVTAANAHRMHAPTRGLARIAELPTVVLLTAIAAFAAALRFVADLAHTTPRYFPDEYLYSALARSIGRGSLEIRGEPAHFPALLESVVTAPLWLFGSVDTSFRLVQLLHALIAALVVVPVFSIARRLELPRWQQLACAALAPALPVFLLSAYLTADTLGATLTLAAMAVGFAALVEPSRRTEAAFIALAGLATLARFQYVVIVPAFVVAILIVRRGRPLAAARSFPLVTATLACAAAVGMVLGPSRLLGYYDSLLEFHLSAPSLAKWAATDLLFVGYASGVALAPLALVGLVGGLARPRSAAERAFTALATGLLALITVEAALYATNGSARFQERYFMAVLPLVAPLACLGLRRAALRPARISLGLITFALLVTASRMPVSDYTIGDGDQDSPFLHAVAWLDRGHGHAAAGLVIAVAVSVVAALSGLFAVSQRGGPLVFALAAVAVVGTSFVAIREDAQRSENTRALALASDARWVDRSGSGDVAVLVPRDALRWVISEQLFWNRSISRVLTLPGAPDADAFQNTRVHIDDRGILREGQRPVTSSLLIEEYASTAQVTGADLIAREGTTSLWKARPGKELRFVSVTDGRYLDGWLGWPAAQVTVWPGAAGSRRGVLCLPLSLPEVSAPVTLDLWGAGYERSVTIQSGGQLLVAIPHTVTTPWKLHVRARNPVRIGTRLLSALVENPSFVTGKASAPACR